MDSEIKSIDWQNCIELSNNKPELAKDILEMFVADMPNAKADIEKAYQDKDMEALENYAHKLHGACCYVGVPKIRAIVRQLESGAKSKQASSCGNLIDEMVEEMGNIQRSVDSGDYQQ